MVLGDTKIAVNDNLCLKSNRKQTVCETGRPGSMVRG